MTTNRGPAHAAADGPAEETLLRISAVAERLGVAASTLRTWERRYGLRPTGHSAGSHRLYTALDLTRLIIMRQLTVQGVAAAQAAEMALADERCCEETAPDPGVSTVTAMRLVVESPTEPAPTQPAQAQNAPTPTANKSTEPAIGPLDTDLRCVSTKVRKALRLAQRFDQERLHGYLTDEVEQVGLLAAWETLLVPALHVVGRHWAVTGTGIEIEHLLSNVTRTVLNQYSSRYPERRGLVLMAAAENERHDLPLAALNAALAEQGVRAVSLGADTPCESLMAAMSRLQPDVLVVLAIIHTPNLVCPQLRQLAKDCPSVLAGPGWMGLETPHEAVVTMSLEDTLQALIAATFL